MENFSPSERIVLKTLMQDFNQVHARLYWLAQTIVNQKISKYPIFIVCNTPILLGVKIQDMPSTQFEFRASHLEEFIKKEVIAKAALVHFRSHYPDPGYKACLFIVTETFQKFIFAPYPHSN